MKKILLVLLMSMFMISLVNAYTSQEKDVGLDYSFMSNNATQCNLTTGNTPYGLVIINQVASRSGQTFNISISSSVFSSLGDYCFNLACTDGVSIETGSLCRTVTGNGNNAPDGIVIVVFGIAFVVIVGFLLYELIMCIGHFASLDIDVVDLAKSFGTYFALFAIYQLSKFYLGNLEIESLLLILIRVGAFTHIIIPLTGFLISITVGSLSKKKVDFGTRRIMRRQLKIGKV